MKINILYSSDYFIAVEKPAGMIIHEKSIKEINSEEENLLKLVRNELDKYVYPIHRLDQPVSGIVLFGLDKNFVRAIKDVWDTSLVCKEYILLVKGNIWEKGEINLPIRDEQNIPRFARTLYWPIWTDKFFSLLKVHIKTGRRHQIRKHFSKRLLPIMGDYRYGSPVENESFSKSFGLNQIFLHHHKLTWEIPEKYGIGQIQSPLPENLKSVLSELGCREF
jgi:23S rRNA-/tRNA-specific pseudouridylate synthase